MTASIHSRRFRVLSASIAFGGLLLFATAQPASGSPYIELAEPVDGHVLRTYDNHGKYASGHAGIDFYAPRASAVRSAAPGRVVFAGSVAGNTSITISHAGGWLTTYSFLLEVKVSRGEEVGSGREIGLSGQGHVPGSEGIHFSLRLDGEYRDPAPFFSRLPAHLSDAPTKPGVPESRRGVIHGARLGSGYAALADAAAGLGRGFLDLAFAGADWTSRAVNAASRFVSDAAEKLRRAGADLANGATRIATEAGVLVAGMVTVFDPGLARLARDRARAAGREAERRMSRWLDSKSAAAMEIAGRQRGKIARKARVFERLNAFRESQRDCVPNEVPLPQEQEESPIVVLVGGFGSSLQLGGLPFDIDLAAAGIAHRDVMAFSYSGFAPDPGSGRPAPFEYRASDTWNGINVASELLIRYLSEIRRRFPRRRVAIVAHSQGGIVARKALVDSGGNLTPPPLADRLVTIGSPHQGSRVANRIAAVRDTRLGGEVIDVASRATKTGGRSQSLADLADGSEVMRDLGARLPPGIPVTSIAAAEDLVVPATQSWIRGADNVLVATDQPGTSAHSGQLRDVRTMRALELALRGGVPCEPFERWATSDRKSELIEEAIEGFGDFATDIVRSADPP
ncbi:MAG: hypothetical protein DCC49_12595 [Acidobacteria bacterium]|nr:MAG: hypothetical protein DCC49_12595 [Acidobacteriota bacterium]